MEKSVFSANVFGDAMGTDGSYFDLKPSALVALGFQLKFLLPQPAECTVPRIARWERSLKESHIEFEARR